MSKKDKQPTADVVEVVAEIPPPPKKMQKRMYRLELERAELENYRLRLEIAEQECKTTEAMLHIEEEENREDRKGIFVLSGDINRGKSDFLREQLMAYGRATEGAPITLIISSGGGEAFSAFMLHDTLRTLSKQGHHVTTVIRGMAASGAGVVAQAGDTRLMGTESYLMLHEAATMAAGTASDIADRGDLMKRLTKQMAAIYARRSKKMTKDEIYTKMCRTDWWVSATEAKRLGFVDEVN